jgi:hypothetical protein
LGVLLIAAGTVCAIGSYVIANGSSRTIRWRHERHAQAAWAPCNRNAHRAERSTFSPLSDRAAAALVTHQPESRPYNARPYLLSGRRFSATNAYVPTTGEITAFRRSRTSSGEPVLDFNPYFRAVDGRDGLDDPSTDDLVQWAAHKWGIPEDWLRAEYVQESYWSSFQLGDAADVGAAWYDHYPVQARIAGGRKVYQSMGITQVKWAPDGSIGPGAEPLRWKSTAFNTDYQAAMIRLYYDDPRGARSSWGDQTYTPCQPWSSIGGWYQPYPWGNSGQRRYIREVQHHLRDRDWASGAFASWTPSDFPPGVRFK